MKHIATLFALFVVIGLSGCASNSDLEEVRALAQQANTTADEALRTARSAEDIAQEAKATSENTANSVEQMAKGKRSKHK